MAAKTEAYVDTSALIAFADRSDSYHDIFVRAFSAPPKLITSSLVVSEGHAWFLRRYDRYRALQFLSMIDMMNPLRVLSVSYKDQQSAGEFLRKFNDQDLTIVDGVGLLMMQKHDIASCWSTDFHLGLTGVPLLIHQY